MDIIITNFCTRDMTGISLFHSGTTPYLLGSLAAPSDSGFMATLCAILHLCNAALLSRRHRQPPQTRFAPPKLPQPLIHLGDVASLLARRVGCICLPVWSIKTKFIRGFYRFYPTGTAFIRHVFRVTKMFTTRYYALNQLGTCYPPTASR